MSSGKKSSYHTYMNALHSPIHSRFLCSRPCLNFKFGILNWHSNYKCKNILISYTFVVLRYEFNTFCGAFYFKELFQIQIDFLLHLINSPENPPGSSSWSENWFINWFSFVICVHVPQSIPNYLTLPMFCLRLMMHSKSIREPFYFGRNSLLLFIRRKEEHTHRKKL